MKCQLVSLILATACFSQAQGQMSAAQQANITWYHNYLRSQLLYSSSAATINQPCATTMPMLTWDATAASIAQNYANQCIFAHNANRGAYGENIAMSSDTTAAYCAINGVSCKGPVADWWSEWSSYTFAPISRRAAATGHYTQIAWATTTSVGCGVANCPSLQGLSTGGIFVVCDYSPPGKCPYLSNIVHIVELGIVTRKFYPDFFPPAQYVLIPPMIM